MTSSQPPDTSNSAVAKKTQFYASALHCVVPCPNLLLNSDTTLFISTPSQNNFSLLITLPSVAVFLGPLAPFFSSYRTLSFWGHISPAELDCNRQGETLGSEAILNPSRGASLYLRKYRATCSDWEKKPDLVSLAVEPC